MKRKNLNWILAIIVLPMMTGCSSFKPKKVGLKNGKLLPCPAAPKCVSSYYTKGIHHIKPLKYSSSKGEAYNKLISIINNIDKSKIITADSNYIHAQFTVTMIKWVDNMEFLFDDKEQIIHYSSTPSAKLGYWDWGENRRRAKLIKKLFDQEE